MKKPHKHAEVIKAWADGKEVEFRHAHCHSTWLPVGHLGTFFDDSFEYRIKPEPVKTVGYRRYIYKYYYKDGYIVMLATTMKLPIEYEKQEGFIKWIDTEWQFHEVEGVNE